MVPKVCTQQEEGGAIAAQRITGRPHATQFWKPPMTSVASRPRSRSVTAARLDEYPSLQMMTTRWWSPIEASLNSLFGSSRHSKTLRSMTSAPEITPSRCRCSNGRMSTRRAPAPAASWASPGARRRRRRRASARSASMLVTVALSSRWSRDRSDTRKRLMPERLLRPTARRGKARSSGWFAPPRVSAHLHSVARPEPLQSGRSGRL